VVVLISSKEGKRTAVADTPCKGVFEVAAAPREDCSDPAADDGDAPKSELDSTDPAADEAAAEGAADAVTESWKQGAPEFP
jgi:hypothetical protein